MHKAATPDITAEIQAAFALQPVPRLLLAAPEAAAALGISERLLSELTASGRIGCTRINRAVRYSLETLRAFVEASTTEATASE